jgi:hypothetical protein
MASLRRKKGAGKKYEVLIHVQWHSSHEIFCDRLAPLDFDNQNAKEEGDKPKITQKRVRFPACSRACSRF